MIRFAATIQQLKQIAANAINASLPMGMGHIHYRATDKFVPESIELSSFGGISLDYVKGRMVKLRIQKTDVENEWEISPNISVDYQSWKRTYATVQELLLSVPEVKIISQEIPDEPA